MLRRTPPILLAFLVLPLAAPSARAVEPGVGCAAAKARTAGSYFSCRARSSALALKTGEPADFTRCDQRFSRRW